MLNIHDKVTNKKAVQIIHAFKKKQDFKNSVANAAKKEEKNKKILAVFNRLSDFSNEKKFKFINQMKRDYEEMKILKKTVEVEKLFEGSS